MSDLVSNGFFINEEYDIFNFGYLFLWEVWYVFYLIIGCGENWLLFEYQCIVVEMFGYWDSNVNFVVEKFMKCYYCVVFFILQFNDMLLQYFDEVIVCVDEFDFIELVNRCFQVCNGYIEVKYDKLFEYIFFVLLEVFVILVQKEEIKGICVFIICLIWDNCYLVDEYFCNDICNIFFFMELLCLFNKIYMQLYWMKWYGIFGNYILEFGQVIGQMQFDFFYIYIVDVYFLYVL